MFNELKVVNACLGIMGEVPINTLTEEHAMKGAALAVLDRVDQTVQAQDWWYNMEKLTLIPSTIDNRIYLPTDTATMTPIKDRPDIVQRGRVLYDLERGTNIFPDGTSFTVYLKRRIPLDEVPVSVAAYITRRTVLEFQMEYDGDATKTRQLTLEVYGGGDKLGLEGIAKAEHIRNRKVNFIEMSPGLARIRRRAHRIA